MPLTRVQSQTPNATNEHTKTKRNLSPDDSTTSSGKKSKTSKMSANEFQELKNMLTSITSTLSDIIDQSQVLLENKITTLNGNFNTFADKVNNEVKAIQESVNQFQDKITSDINSMNVLLNSHTDRLDNTDDDIQRVQLSQDVRLVGFAVKENENLFEIFRKIADEIGFAIADNVSLPTIERMPTKNHATGQMMMSPNILIHFNSIRQKQRFFHYI